MAHDPYDSKQRLEMRLDALRQIVEQTPYTDDERRAALATIRERRNELHALEIQMQHEVLEMQTIEAVHRAALSRAERDLTN